jgi:hypothetical protein
MGVPPGNRRVLVSVPERYVAEPTPEDAKKGGHIRGRSKLFMKYPGYKCTLSRWRLSVSRLWRPALVVQSMENRLTAMY